MSKAQPFRIEIEQSALDRIDARVADYRWFDAPQGGTDAAWVHGLSLIHI